MRMVAIIPALDEAACIGQVVSEIDRAVVDRVIVVDNGSTDDTAAVALQAGAEVIREPRRGYGYACAAGAAAAGDRVDVLVFMDGDGSDDPNQLVALLAPVHSGEADLVLGSRSLDASANHALLAHQRWGNRLTTALVQLLYGVRLGDLPPLKAIRRDTLAQLEMSEMTYGWTVEMIVKSAKRGYRIVEVPVAARERIGGQSKVSGTLRGTVLAAYHLLRTTIKHARRG